MAYIEAQDVLNVLTGIDTSGISDVETLLDSVLIPSAQAEVDRFIGYTIQEKTQTKYFDGNDQVILPLKMRPIQSVSSVVTYYVPYSSVYQTISASEIAKINTVDKYGNTITTESTPGESTKLVVNCALGELQVPEADQTLRLYFGTPGFIRGRNNVKVTFTSGYPTANMPQQIKDAAAYISAMLLLVMVGNTEAKGAVSIKIGQVTKQYGSAFGKTAVAYAGTLDKFEVMTIALLTPFKSITV